MSQFCTSSNYTMKPIISFSCILFFFTTISARSFSNYITPNFSASYLEFIHNFGMFLFSHNKTFKVGIFNPGGQQTSFYLCVIHAASHTIIWSANSDAPSQILVKCFYLSKGSQLLMKMATPNGQHHH